MKLAATKIVMCVALLLGVGGCSEEERPPGREASLAKPIRMPIRKIPASPAPAKEASPEAKEKKAGPGETVAGERRDPTAAPETMGKKEEGLEPPREEKAREEEKAAALDKKPLKAEGVAAEGRQTKAEGEAAYHTVRKGESLSLLAGRKEVYGDPLKWPILFRHNPDALADISLDDGLADREIPEGRRLRFLTPKEVETNLRSRSRNLWVVNIFSGTGKAEIMPQVVKLLKLKYPIYITRATVQGTEWMRLRLGFFASKRDADEEGAKIMALLKLMDSWSTRIGENEFEEFGGY